ncbi:hypothetical protein [Blastococcus sp. LR1]|uniref:hypothetical protein n=1 Tax=Blastococcus sp. LR1 TaxID=2877000 RepID=UPI001CCFBBFE|nr:hypothetical protein [Blastococcus sp. LR1]MCA0146590.1 hypothetical protein [Blastococcus sp. LR1]
MPPTALSGPRTFTRRTLLAVSAVGLVAVAGCTSSDDGQEAITSEQADELAGQVAVQETLVAAYELAFQADPALAAAAAELVTQAGEQLDRLRAAAPGDRPAGAAPADAPPVVGAQEWLRAQVAAAATSHAAACLDQTGARAALLGSIAAGLRGHEALLA